MLSLIEIAVAAWVVLSVGLAIWTYHDAWMLAFSRGWAAVVLLFGPVGLLAYLARSRLFGMKAGSTGPEYEQRRVEDGIPGQARKSNGIAHGTSAAAHAAGSEFETARLTQGLPRCPRCNSAVSYYDVKCLRCGQLIKPAAAAASI